MPTASAITAIVKQPLSDAAVDIWARLTQEPIPSSADEANIKDLHQMIAAAMAGESAYEYVYDSCPYVVIIDGVVRITLPFFVWPSDLGLAYDLTASAGTISPGVAHEEFRSFDVIFDHAAVADYEAIFVGGLTPEMPFFRADGSEIPEPEIIAAGSLVTLPEPLTTVLRAEGKVYGFRHELVIEVVKAAVDPEAGEDAEAELNKVQEPESAITVAWRDENGETQTDILDMKIPGCVLDLLETCEDGTPKGDPQQEGERYVVYYSTCNGEEFLARWEDGK